MILPAFLLTLDKYSSRRLARVRRVRIKTGEERKTDKS